MNIENILSKSELNHDDLTFLLGLEDAESIEKLRASAYNTMKNLIGEKVYLRGLVEYSNICVNDCYYCGIRKSNSEFERYTLSREQVMDAARWAVEKDYGSFVLQSGERRDRKFVDTIVSLVEEIKKITISQKNPNGLGITLCVGEQSYSDYKRFFDAGAHRYLLRIETTSPELYSRYHPSDMKLDERKECLKYLKDIGFQTGTGVMIGMPGQTYNDLACDIEFFKEYDIDMIGMGPFIPHGSTPLKEYLAGVKDDSPKRYKLALKMIAATRLYLKDVNIASTTALQAIHPEGREEGLRFGANIIMPQITPTEVRKEYQLYEGKPCIDEFASQCHNCLTARIDSTGREVGFGAYGDSKHFKKKND